MSQKVYTLDNHRPLRFDEIIRKGDFYKTKNGDILPVKFSIGHRPDTYSAGRFTFWRRRHTRKPTPAPKRPVVPTVKPALNTPRFPEVKFLYPSTKRWGAPVERHVKVISQDETYIVGLEVLEGGGHQFKKFCINKVKGEIRLIRF